MATTIADLIARAGAATDGGERRRCLAEAERLARSPQDLIEVATGWAALPAGGALCDEDRAAARSCIELACGVADAGEVWVFRHAAELEQAFGDPATARRWLESYRALLAGAPAKPVYLFKLLAEGYVATVDDRAAALAVLAEGRARAAETDDLCSIADGLHELGGDGAEALAAQAEELAAGGEFDGHAWWTVANLWSGWGKNDRARAVLDRGLGLARTSDGCVTLAKAWSSHGQPGDVRRALEAGHAFASSAGEWLKLAEAHHDHDGDLPSVILCLERALAAATAPADRRRIAFAFRTWLGDGVRADAIAPRGFAPGESLEPKRELPGWPAHPGRLFDWLRARVDDPRLETIASYDYGTDTPAHLAALGELRDTGLLPQPLDWHPLEVLQLTRWSDGGGTDHLARAFACTVLVIDSVGDASGEDGGESTVPILVESCRALGDEATAQLAELLAYGFAHARWDHEPLHGFLALGLLCVAAARDPADPRLEPLASLTCAAFDALGRDRLPQPDQGWLLGCTFFDQRHDLWRALGRECLPESGRLTDRPNLARIQLALAPGAR